MKITWTQRNISPIITRICSRTRMGMDRRALQVVVSSIYSVLNDTQKTALKLSLNRQNIIKKKYQQFGLDLDLGELNDFNFRKTVKLRGFIDAAADFFNYTGRHDLYNVSSDIAHGGIKKNIFIPEKTNIDHDILLKMAKTRILNEMDPDRSKNSKIIDTTFEIAQKCDPGHEIDLIYRMRKIADIGGDLQAIIASLFMGVPDGDIGTLLTGNANGSLSGFANSTVKIVEKFRALNDSFKFCPDELSTDKKYLSKKMSELIKKAEYPQALLLFFLEKLMTARKAEDKTESIFDEIRYIYAPLAERSGLIFLADDFRDQYLRLSRPEEYKDVEEQVKKRLHGMSYDDAKVTLSFFARELASELFDKIGGEFLRAVIKFRVKSVYSIWNKAKVREEYEINDILAAKIIVESDEMLQKVVDNLKKCNSFTLDPKKPIKVCLENSEEDPSWSGVKMNGIYDGGIPMELQIVTKKMHKENTLGKVADWFYNLIKELNGIEQLFTFLPPKELISTDFEKNFYLFRDFYIDETK